MSGCLGMDYVVLVIRDRLHLILWISGKRSCSHRDQVCISWSGKCTQEQFLDLGKKIGGHRDQVCISWSGKCTQEQFGMDYLSNNLEKFELDFSVGKCRPDLYSELGLFTNFSGEQKRLRCSTLF
ncbi:hypothetical protein QE152_g41337 [Popillia japonica]|uniref:Uncharacterized protein n=1 Tax=Popillia japonica TaxID=7064 RepID=A0AAW1GRU6_POPJA